MIKKITIALIATLGSASALAGNIDNTPLPTNSGLNLIAPHQEGSWSFGLQANYFEPNNDFNYAVVTDSVSNSTNTVTQNQTKTAAVGTDYNWGWGADITYHFPGDGRDVTLAFTQLNTSSSDSVDVSNNPAAFLMPTGSVSGFNRFVQSYNESSGEVKTNYDSADLTFGQVIAIGSRITLHPFAGARYAYINYKASAAYTDLELNNNNVLAPDAIASQTLKSKFQGAGPRLGSDAAVNLGAGFSLRTTLGVSLLAGSMDIDNTFDSAFYDGTGALIRSTTNYHDVESNTRVVPEADAKLSAMYDMDFNNGYALGLEVGYQVTNYFDAIQDSVISTVDTSTNYTNFFMQGPFARLQLDVA